jgi:hypothetical protein
MVRSYANRSHAATPDEALQDQRPADAGSEQLAAELGLVVPQRELLEEGLILGRRSSSSVSAEPNITFETTAATSGSNNLYVLTDRAAGQQLLLVGFLEKDLWPAFQEANVPPPIRAEWFAHAGEMHRHSQTG